MIHLKSDKAKIILTIVNLALIIGLGAVFFWFRDALNTGFNKRHIDYDDIPTVTAEDGVLKYNSVSVKVPKENASYTVGFDWGKDDRAYPTVPSTASAYYMNGDQTEYEILLYRDSVTPKDELEQGKTADNWFDGWEGLSDADAQQTVYETPKTKGILVKTISNEGEGESENKYCSYTYYFVAETKSSIEQYILELNFFSADSVSKAEDTFKACANSLSVKKNSKKSS